MTRIGVGDPIVKKPSSNVYTALLAVAVLVQIIALVAMWIRHNEVFGVGMLGGG